MKKPRKAYALIDGKRELKKVSSIFQLRGRWFFTYKWHSRWSVSDYLTGRVVCQQAKTRKDALSWATLMISVLCEKSYQEKNEKESINDWKGLLNDVT